MKCSKCEHYRFNIHRCVLGMINPKTIKAGVEAARVMSTAYICEIDEENTAKKAKIVDRLMEG